MRQRPYPETIPVLASFWLKAVFERGYGLRRWKQLNSLLRRVLSQQRLDEFSRQAILDIQTWIQQAVLTTRELPPFPHPRLDGTCATLTSDRLPVFIRRLLNEWLPVEVARLLITESVPSLTQEDGMPVLAVGRALERLLVREYLSPGTLEMLLQPELFSPHYVYPADLEMLQDVVLSLLGRTSAPLPSVMPATLLCVSPEAPLPSAAT